MFVPSLYENVDKENICVVIICFIPLSVELESWGRKLSLGESPSDWSYRRVKAAGSRTTKQDH